MAFDYPVKVEPTSTGGFIGTFRDVPEAISEGSTIDETLEFALEALILSIDFYRDDFKPFPHPSKPVKGELIVSIPASVSAKILLLNAMTESNTRPADLARKMDVKRQDITRLLNVRHSTKIDTVEKALFALGKKLALSAS